MLSVSNGEIILFADSRDDMQPNEDFSMKMMRWIRKLGLDQVSEIDLWLNLYSLNILFPRQLTNPENSITLCNYNIQ